MKNQEEIYFDNGCTFMDRGKYQLAIIEFTKAINLEPNEFGASYENRAVAKCFLGDFGSAIPDYLKAISICKTALLNPNENYKQICIDLSFSLYNLASCQTRMCNYKTALLNLEESLSYFPYNEPNLAGVSMDEINTMISINKKIEAAIEILDKETLEYIHKCDVKNGP
ncbi:MAG: tetratricopeptide repeat protein [Bacteroidetes bacterium]|nr:tetratricopeptide repeat protein [Bacteroidota bacterium]